LRWTRLNVDSDEPWSMICTEQAGPTTIKGWTGLKI